MSGASDPNDRPTGPPVPPETDRPETTLPKGVPHDGPPLAAEPLPRSYYDRFVVDVARETLGTVLVCTAGDGTRTSGLIVETEAYLAAGDPACHAYQKKTRRNAAMFGPPGTAYVYMIHAKWCFNIVCQAEGEASAVLVRALVPVENLITMSRRRHMPTIDDPPTRRQSVHLTSGPARLCQALAIDGSQNTSDLTGGGTLWLERRRPETTPLGFDGDAEVLAGPRIGISRGVELPLRFFYRHHPHVSGPRKAHDPPERGAGLPTGVRR